MGLVRALRRGATLVSLGAAGGALVITVRHLLETPQPLISVLPGEARIDRKHGGDIYYNVAGPLDAEPLVLLHDFYPGASNYEFREIFQSLASQRRVYAPDWLGFGMSEHPHVAYTGEFYASVLTGFIRDVVARPATVLAHGRAANIAVRAASDTPGLFDRLILVSPYARLGDGHEPTVTQTLVRGLQRASLGIVPYALVSTRPILRWGANARSAQTGEGASSAETIDHSYSSAHQFGGHHAMLALLTGAIDLPMRNSFALLEPPALIVSGALDRVHTRVEMEDLAVLNQHADLEILPDAGETAYRDQPDAFVALVARWLSTPQTRHVLDESALLPPIEREPAGVSSTPATTVSGTPASSSGPRAGAAPSTPAGTSTPTGAVPEDTGALKPPLDASSYQQAGAGTGAEESDPMTGTPGYVVPGVSDMGLDALATVTYGGVGNIDPSATQDEQATHALTLSDESSPEALLPEAGDAEPSDAAEHQARAEGYPLFDPESNIASVTTAETDVTTPGETVETPQEVTTAGEAQEDVTESTTPIAPRPPNPTQPRRSTSRSEPSQTTRSAPREPGARMEGRATKSSGKSTGGKASGEGSDAAKHHPSRKHHK